MMKTDTEMSNVLYYTNLERHLNLKQQKDNQIPTVQLAVKNNEDNEGKKPQETVNLSDLVVVENTPKSIRQRAAAILTRLKTRPDIISWDEKIAEINLEGVKIPHSNI